MARECLARDLAEEGVVVHDQEARQVRHLAYLPWTTRRDVVSSIRR
jgi:hypothetical protein